MMLNSKSYNKSIHLANFLVKTASTQGKVDSEEKDRTPEGSPISTRLSGPQEPPRDKSTSRPSPKPDNGNAKMAQFEDLDGNESAHIIDCEYGGLDVPIMRTP